MTFSELKDNMSIEKLKTIHGVSRSEVDDGLVDSGNVVFGAEPTNDDFTVEKLTSTATLTSKDFHPDILYLLAVERKPNTENEAFYPGDLTIYAYNHIKVNGTNSKRVLHTTHTSSSTNITQDRDYLIQGLGVGQGECSFGLKFAADVASTQIIYWKLYRL